jgi:hypothetical protein
MVEGDAGPTRKLRVAFAHDMLVPTPSSPAKFSAAIEACRIPAIGGRQIASHVGRQGDGQARRGLVERARALHLPPQDQIGRIGVHDATRRVLEIRGEMNQVEAVELTKTEVGDHEIERGPCEAQAGGFKADLVIHARHGSCRVQKIISDRTIWFDQEDARQHSGCTSLSTHGAVSRRFVDLCEDGALVKPIKRESGAESRLCGQKGAEPATFLR